MEVSILLAPSSSPSISQIARSFRRLIFVIFEKSGSESENYVGFIHQTMAAKALTVKKRAA
jgi:hypothetical protein